jgi:hypothetical protein
MARLPRYFVADEVLLLEAGSDYRSADTRRPEVRTMKLTYYWRVSA